MQNAFIVTLYRCLQKKVLQKCDIPAVFCLLSNESHNWIAECYSASIDEFSAAR